MNECAAFAVLSLVVGCLAGVAVMCLLAVSRDNDGE